MSTQKEKTAGCANCPIMEEKYKNNPRSFWMRIWHWHSGWCPGHQAYLKAQREAKSANPRPVQ
jgi:hypothetical protein